jgi:Kef-type K+ transport system membrane component KefB
MINMMKDILQYVPYALFLGAVFLLLFAGLAITVNYFRKEGRRTAKR